MKSNIKRTEVNDNKIILSIGMIVKNEEKHLDKCLTALQNLMNQISSELIIVDTGSTDRTKEIALKYTDKVYDFEWINDFSAARNCGLEKAQGEWFMFLDADEYVDEDVHEMVQFFNMPEVRQKYNSASYIIRNYTAEHSKNCTDFLGSRMVRLLPGVKFHDSIHEWLPQPHPHGTFTTVFHHYGYVYKTKSDKEKKWERNRQPMIEEYNENPRDQRILAHMYDVFGENEEKERYLKEWINVAKEEPTHTFRNACYVTAASFYARTENFDEALKMCDEFFEVEGSDQYISAVAIYPIKAHIYINREEYDKAYENLMKYFETYEKYKQGKLKMIDLRCKPINGLQVYEYQEQVMKAARCLFNMGKSNEALEMLEKTDISELNIPNLRIYFNIIRDLVFESKNYNQLALYYDKLLKLNDIDKIDLILYLMEQYYIENEDERKDFVRAISNSEVNGHYIELMKLIENPNDRNFKSRLQQLLDTNIYWSEGFSEAIYLAMKYDADMSIAINKMSYEQIRDKFPIIAKVHKDYANTALEYCKTTDRFVDSIRKLFWMISALETAVLSCDNMPKNERLRLYNNFTSSLADYVMNIYNHDLLNPEDIEVLPPLHRFGYYMGMAQTALLNNNTIEYIKNLKDSLKYCEPMKDIVSLYLEQFEQAIY